jgi:hypothetical protein
VEKLARCRANQRISRPVRVSHSRFSYRAFYFLRLVLVEPHIRRTSHESQLDNRGACQQAFGNNLTDTTRDYRRAAVVKHISAREDARPTNQFLKPKTLSRMVSLVFQISAMVMASGARPRKSRTALSAC